MAWATTVIELSTTPVLLIGATGSTWATLRGASITDPVSFIVVNESTVQAVRIGGTSTPTGTTGSGLPLAIAGGALSYNLLASDPIFAWTTASTGRVTVSAGRQ